MSDDVGRTAVYAAELAAFDGTSYESLCDLARLQAMAAAVTGSDWWPAGQIPVRAARSSARSSSASQLGEATPVIRLAAPQRTPATLIHELAHVLAGIRGGHGSVFRRAHVDLAASVLGTEPAAWLADAYAAMNLALAERRWPTPPLFAQNALAL